MILNKQHTEGHKFILEAIPQSESDLNLLKKIIEIFEDNTESDILDALNSNIFSMKEKIECLEYDLDETKKELEEIKEENEELNDEISTLKEEIESTPEFVLVSDCLTQVKSNCGLYADNLKDQMFLNDIMSNLFNKKCIN